MDGNMKRILIVPEYWLPHIFSLIKGFYDLRPEGVQVSWTSRKWLRSEHCISTEWENPDCMPVEAAMRALDRGEFDAVVFTDGTVCGYLTRHLAGRTKRIILDSADHRHVVDAYLHFADIYLKTQHPRGQAMVGDSIVLSNRCPGIPVVPWPYCTAVEAEESIFSGPMISKPEPFVHFRGWGWPPKRTAIVEKLRTAGIPFKGGLYARPELHGFSGYPDELIVDRIPFRDYLAEMRSCMVALNPVGNGEICFRTYEIWRCGICMVSHKLDVKFPGPEPVHGREWIVCDTDEEIIETCKALLADPETCARIGAAGRLYWERYCQPAVAASRLLDVLGWSER